ncbi:MAG: MoaD/ThiS family protein [Steroidobacteraceae bacterium]
MGAECKVNIPSPLRSYTHDAATVAARGDNVDAILRDLDARYSGLRFRIIDEQDAIRPHIRIYVNETVASDIGMSVRPGATLHLICALSGG